MPPPPERKHRGRGRPPKSARDRDAMKAEISATARRLFQSEGYANISIRRLAKEVGCAPMTLYQHFDAKIDILRTLWGAVFADLVQKLDAAAEEADPPTRLKALGRAHVAYWLAHEDHYRLVFMTEGVDQQEVGAFIGNPHVARSFLLIGQAIKDLRPGDADAEITLKSDHFICLLQGIAHNHITISGYPWSDPGEIVDRAVDTWR